MARITHRAVDSLGDDVRRVIAEGYRAGHTAAAVYRDVCELLGEDESADISERTVSRELRRLDADRRERAAARKQTIALLEAAKAVPGTAAEILGALATQSLLERPARFTDADPVQVQRANLEAEKIRLKRAKLDQDNQRLALDREKFEGLKTKLAIIRKQAEAAKEAVNKAGESISPELRKQLEDVYDLTEAEA